MPRIGLSKLPLALGSVNMRRARLVLPAIGLLAFVVLASQLVFRAEAIPLIVDLNSTSALLEVLGDDEDDELTSVATGDINGDTIGDLIVSARQAASDFGATYVIYGSASLPATIDLDITAADLIVTGAADNEPLGDSIAAGDINGDTVDDLVIGAISAHAVYVIYGSASLPATIDLSTASADLVVIDNLGGVVGRAVAVADVNGDTVGDLVVGAPGATTPGGFGAGKVYVVYGGATLPATIDLDVSSADVTVLGDDSRDNLGEAVATGDVNGDTVQDLILGAPTQFGTAARAKAYVIYGGALPSVIDLGTVAADFTMIGVDRNDDLAVSLASADINGDTMDDVIVGGGDLGARIEFGVALQFGHSCA